MSELPVATLRRRGAPLWLVLASALFLGFGAGMLTERAAEREHAAQVQDDRVRELECKILAMQFEIGRWCLRAP